MALWNANKAFRADYESRILQSLDQRQLSKDGRLRNFNEKPLIVVERPAPPEAEAVKAKVVKETPKKEVAPPEEKVEKAKSAKNQKEGNKKTESILEKSDQEYEQEAPPPEKLQKDADKKVDEKKLKELKKEEELAKRKQAEERKRKLAEKAAAKAAIKAQMEAEKKLKERCFPFHLILLQLELPRMSF